MKLIGNKYIDRFTLLICGGLMALVAYYVLHISGDDTILMILSIVIIAGYLKEKELQKEIKSLKEELKNKRN